MDIYKIISTVFSLINVYITYRMIKIFNRSNAYNKKIEFMSYIGFFIINLIMLELTDNVLIILFSNIITLFALTFNYSSSLRSKIITIIIIPVIIIVMITALFFLPSLTTTATADESNIHLFIYCVIIEFTTLSFLLRIEDKRELKEKGNIYWYLPAILPLIAICVEIDIISLTQKHVIFNLFLIAYILAAFKHLYSIDQLKSHEDKKLMQQQIDNYHDQYNHLKTSAHIIMEMHYNMELHFWAVRKLAEDNKIDQLLAYIDKLIVSPKNEVDFIRTGNLTMDSIINVKFAEAKEMGIEIEHNFLIPANLNIDNYDMTTILAGLLNCAINAIRFYPDKKLIFTMKYEKKSLLYISMLHANTVADEERKKYKYIYKDDVAMKGVERAAEKYSGGMESEIDGDKVMVSVLLFVPPRDKVVI